VNDIIGFKTKEKYYVIDHILTQKNMNIGFLKNKSLNIQIIMREIAKISLV
jgi:hypothetical protein